MNVFLKVALALRLVEEDQTFTNIEPVSSEVLVIPAGSTVEGEIHTNLEVIVAGVMDGSINIRGDARLTVLEDASVRNGLVSADYVVVHGEIKNGKVDVQRLDVSETGRIEGASKVRYDKLVKHDDAPINGLLGKRRSVRDGFAHITREPLDIISN